MGFFKRLFGGRSNEEYLSFFCRESIALANQSESVYFELVQRIGARTNISGVGLFLARLHAALFAAYGFRQKAKCSIDEFNDFLNIASGVALGPLLDESSETYCSREDASNVALAFAKRVIAGINREVTDGPSTPFNTTQGLRQLIDLYHEVLAYSLPDYDSTFRAELDHRVWGWNRACIEHMARTICES